MSHGGNRFWRTEFAAEASELRAEVTLALEERGGGEPERGRRPD
jgi:hypothetical protein